ncbi:MAG TPA: D-Ala-D-Ala carboxypeptidase family metallohydrolase [Chthoniobacterales bacterium]|nr:D-Ala-D-Ala carboxypeptidase family metallohydrolase [Chthoniobacterales bacterium]
MKAIDGLILSPEHRAALRPGEAVTDENGKRHHLPRFFFEVPSWEEAHSFRVARHFALSELITVDSREAELLLRTFPHYVPCAILALARYLEDFRREVDAPVFISANGGYRSPAHRANKGMSLHSWGTAADIYRVGDTYLNDEKSIARYAEIAGSLGGEVRVRGYREGDDHLQVDLGYLTIVPRECSES